MKSKYDDMGGKHKNVHIVSGQDDHGMESIEESVAEAEDNIETEGPPADPLSGWWVACLAAGGLAKALISLRSGPVALAGKGVGFAAAAAWACRRSRCRWV